MSSSIAQTPIARAPIARTPGTEAPAISTTARLSVMESAGRRVAAQMLGAFLTEALLPPSRLSVSADTAGQLSVSIRIAGGSIRYRASGRRSFAYDRWLIEEGTLHRWEGGREEICSDPCLLLSDLKPELPGDEGTFARFSEEIAQTWTNHATSLACAFASDEALAETPYDLCEAKLTDGHRYHPSFKSRVGFSPQDNRAYGPEFANGLRPLWLAVHEDLATSSAIGLPGRQDRQLLEASWGGAVGEVFAPAHVPAIGDRAPFHYLPVHPWQWERVVEAATAPERAAGRIVFLGQARTRYLAQQSIRTLSCISEPSAPSLKLALSIHNTSTLRTLAPHTVLNAPTISAWLDGLVRSDPFFREAGTVLLLERMGTTATLPARSDPAGRMRGASGAIWRDPIHPYLRDAERAAPFSLLTHLDTAGQPEIAPWIAAHGVADWTQALLRAAMLPVVHFLLAHGVAVESHQQNMVLVHRDGRPARVALKDFHDGVRFIPETLSSSRPALAATPEAHARVNPNSYVEAKDPEDVRDFMFDALFGVNLAELAAFLHRYFGYEERRFWRLARDILLGHLADHPAARQGAERFRFFAPFVAVEDLARRRIDNNPVPPRQVRNPLVMTDTPVGGSGL